MKWLASAAFVLITATSMSALGNWEYLKVVNSQESLSIENLNRLGGEGWELVACPVSHHFEGATVYIDQVPVRPYAYAKAFYCLLKRKKPLEEPCISSQ